MIRARLRSAVLLPALTLAIAGCHKKPPRAYRPPPPPAAGSNKGTYAGRDTTSSTRGNQSAGTAQPLPPAPPDVHGKPALVETGVASWYGPPYAGRKGADGKVYDQNAMTAAHRTLPLGSIVRVTNLTTNQAAVVKITDRGPFVQGRIIDLSLAAAKATGLYRMGVAKVRVEAWTPGPSTGPNSIPGGRWCVQVGAFESEKDALKLKNELMRRYATAKVIEFPGPTGHWVRINPARPDKTHADEVAGSLHVSGDVAPYLVRTD
ncbi:septal ring lytic transglycosylase RlpA family protein [Edaphobacter modestus]|uniref:Probable endolytic peptidoglycan transglycosylase RlpA n=1 Tax=Edaphobacter modestus TaxID=388466 RepID=A0A4Q7YU92_9BACT|nr:septal ring lytic transglycosylase RlpA family protein [Edaphobacter modestus]RZU41160.1 rare lipoprotein A [Edaphobacter modestus]